MAKCKDHNELAHEFAYSRPHESNENRSGNMSYDGNTCWSYETKIAKKYPEHRILIISEYTYSNTTRKQIGELRSAFSHWTIFRSDELDLDDMIKDKLTQLKKYTRNKKHVKRFDNFTPFYKHDREKMLDLWRDINTLIDKGIIKETVLTDLDKKKLTICSNFEIARIEKLRRVRKSRFSCRDSVINYYLEQLKDTNYKTIGELIAAIGEVVYDVCIVRGEIYTVIAKYLGIFDKLGYCSYNRYESVFGEMVWFTNNHQIVTSKGIYLDAKMYADTIYRFAKLYLAGKYDFLLHKHIHVYEITQANEFGVKIGCHTIQRAFIEHFIKEYEIYKENQND